MKKILIFISLIQLQVSLANMTDNIDYIVSHRDSIPVNELSAVNLPIYAGRQFYLLSNYFSCVPTMPTYPSVFHIETNGNSIKVLTGPGGPMKNSTAKCTPLPPPPYPYNKLAEIPALPASANGTYHLSYYSIPYGVTFPPDDSDLPDYLITNFSFNVVAVKSVDSLSSWSLVALTLLLFLIGYTGLKMQRHN